MAATSNNHILRPARKAILTITDNAAAEIKRLISARDKPTVGIKVKVKSGGCSGLSYVFEYADSVAPGDEIIEEKDVKVIVDPKAVMYVIGSAMDFVTTISQKGFVFSNPNEKGSCGCGKSFYV
jgi:iron-sulfur cluster assembly protein